MQIKVEGKNTNYSKILKDNYCGKNSDLFTFLFFKCYSSFYFRSDNYLSINFNKLAGDSLDHINILGQYITLLGDLPSYELLSTNELLYVDDKEKVLELAVRLLKDKIISYTNSMNLIGDDNIKEMLSNFIVEERKNLEIIEILQLKYKRERLW